MRSRATVTLLTSATATALLLSACDQVPETSSTALRTDAATAVSGAGASLAAPVFKQWPEQYGAGHPALALSCDSIGSGARISAALRARELAPGCEVRHLGYGSVRLYNAGWSHWGNTLSLPVVEGPAPYDDAFEL